MSPSKVLRSIHLASTAWFMVCTGYVLALSLRQAGLGWWVIFSLSGHWALVVFLLVSLYLFAIFRGAGKGLDLQVEHPLTTTTYYMAFYVSAPFLGALAGALAILGEGYSRTTLQGITLGTLGATFLTWVIVDPISASLEMAAPAGRKHRAERLAQAGAQKKQEEEERERLLNEILNRENDNRQTWEEFFQPHARRLAALLAGKRLNLDQTEREAVAAGLQAWQTGGLSCMRELRRMVSDVLGEVPNANIGVDYISMWWDGIGDWRSPSLL